MTPEQRTGPELPHERDESADREHEVAPRNRELGHQAHEDVERGLVDTDRGPVIDHVYRRKVGGQQPAPSETSGRAARRKR
jgi:hypothetical protein